MSLDGEELVCLEERLDSIRVVLFGLGEVMVEVSTDFRFRKLRDRSADRGAMSDMATFNSDFEGDLTKPYFSSVPLKLGARGEIESDMTNRCSQIRMEIHVNGKNCPPGLEKVMQIQPESGRCQTEC